MPIVSKVPMVSMVPMCLWSYVKELLGDNRHLYEAFISHTDIDYSTDQNFFNPFYDIVIVTPVFHCDFLKRLKNTYHVCYT